MSRDSLNIELVAITPPKLIFKPIYSLNFTYMPNKYTC